MQENTLKEIVVIFRQGDTFYGLNGSRVIEIIKINGVTRVPKQPKCLWGIYNYKGNIIPIISMKQLCNHEGTEDNTICIILEVNHKIYGFAVEEILDMRYDNGKEIKFQESDFENDNLSVHKIIEFENLIFVLDIPKIILQIEQQTNKEKEA